MKIALFSDTFLPEINGVATSTANLASILRAHGHSVLVVTTNPFNDEVTFEDDVLRIPGIAVKRVYGYRISSFYNKEAMKIIENFGPEFVHIQTDIGIGIFGNVVAVRLGIPKIYTYHTMIEDYAYYVTGGHFDRFARHVVRLFYRGKSFLMDEIIAPSAKSKDYLRSIGIDSTIDVIPTGVDLSRFSKKNIDKKKIASLKQSLGIAKDEKVILSLGRIAEEKSIDVLLRGYAEFLKKGPKIKTKFLIVGWGPAENSLKELALSLGINDKVIFGGKVEPLLTQNYYHLGDVFVSASLSETQGLTFMEAMASEVLVLARYDDNLAGAIVDGETGKFFFDEADFPAKLEEVLTLSPDRHASMIENALGSLDEYSMESCYNRIIEVYSRVRKKYW